MWGRCAPRERPPRDFALGRNISAVGRPKVALAGSSAGPSVRRLPLGANLSLGALRAPPQTHDTRALVVQAGVHRYGKGLH